MVPIYYKIYVDKRIIIIKYNMIIILCRTYICRRPGGPGLTFEHHDRHFNRIIIIITQYDNIIIYCYYSTDVYGKTPPSYTTLYTQTHARVYTNDKTTSRTHTHTHLSRRINAYSHRQFVMFVYLYITLGEVSRTFRFVRYIMRQWGGGQG